MMTHANSNLGRMTYSVQEVADMLGVHPNTIYLWKSAGEIEYTRLGRKIVFTMQQVQDFLDAHREREMIDRSILTTV